MLRNIKFQRYSDKFLLVRSSYEQLDTRHISEIKKNRREYKWRNYAREKKKQRDLFGFRSFERVKRKLLILCECSDWMKKKPGLRAISKYGRNESNMNDALT